MVKSQPIMVNTLNYKKKMNGTFIQVVWTTLSANNNKKKDFIYFCFHSERPEEQLFCVQAAMMLNKFTNAGEKINQ